MEQEKTDILAYLKTRGVTEDSLLSLLTTENEKSQRLFSAGNEFYCISHYLDDSDDLGYSLIKTNMQLRLDSTSYVAIALVEGDDIICVNTEDCSINLWLVENGNSEHIKLADSFSEFSCSLQSE